MKLQDFKVRRDFLEILLKTWRNRGLHRHVRCSSTVAEPGPAQASWISVL